MGELISIIVPMYNREKTISKCLDSILNQTYSNFELIIIDDGSTDNSFTICEQYVKDDDRIKLIHQENQGVSSARNKGLDISEGEYIAFIDSDDYVSDDYLEYLYTLIQYDNTKIAICSHQNINLGEPLKTSFDEGKDIVLSTKDFFEKMLYGELKGIGVSIHSRLIAKELFENIRFPIGKLFEDSAVSYKNLLNTDRVSITFKPKYCYVRNMDSIVQKPFDLTRMEFIDAEEEMTESIKIQFPSIQDAADRRRIYAYLNTLGHMVKANNKEYQPLEVELKNKILMHYSELISNSRVPKKDKLALRILKYSGLIGYRFAFNVFKKKQTWKNKS